MANSARKVAKSAVNSRVRFPPVKANNGEEFILDCIQESKYCLHLEFGPEVVTYFPQPQSFDISGGSCQTTGAAFGIYTPDFLLIYHEGPRRYIEVKRQDKVEDPDNQERWRRFKERHLDPKTEFLVIDEVDIYAQPRLSNLEILYRYRKNPKLDMRKVYTCASTTKGKRTFAQIVESFSETVSLHEIYTWIALGILCFDMDGSILNYQTELEFNVD